MILVVVFVQDERLTPVTAAEGVGYFVLSGFPVHLGGNRISVFCFFQCPLEGDYLGLDSSGGVSSVFE